MGGVLLFEGPDGPQACLWRHQFPAVIRKHLVTHSNPRGRINNSNLELCGNIVHHHVVASLANLCRQTSWTGSDNTADVRWSQRGSTTTISLAACPLQQQTLHQQTHSCIPLHKCVPGSMDAMTDNCSRLWHITDAAFLSHFNAHHPQPASWQQCHLTSKAHSNLHLSLLAKLSLAASPPKLQEPSMPTGRPGAHIARTSTLTHSSATKIQSSPSERLDNCIATGSNPPAKSPSELMQFLTPSAQ